MMKDSQGRISPEDVTAEIERLTYAVGSLKTAVEYLQAAESARQAAAVPPSDTNAAPPV